ncbi:MAG: Gfo/Idh/MocA family protein [Planctomycetota bacterium]
MSSLNYGIFGVNGFAGVHLSAARTLEEEGILSVQAAAEPYQDRCPDTLADLEAGGTVIYEDYRNLLDGENGVDFVSIPTPIPLHVPMTVESLDHGVNVLLEKPPAVLVQDIDRMQNAVDESGLLCQVGFQHMYDGAARELKSRLASGAIGSVEDVVVQGYWRRPDSYYERAAWAGKVRLGDHWVLDGPLNNPLCHYIQNALYIMCPEHAATVRPVSVTAELYHAHPIEGEDTVSARAQLENGATLHTYLTLCAPDNHAPSITFYGSDGRAEWRPGHFSIHAPDLELCEDEQSGQSIMPMRNLASVLSGDGDLHSPLSATRNVILHNNGCFAAAGTIRDIPADVVNRYETEDGDVATEVDGLMEALGTAAEKRKLLGEIEVPWASGPAREVELDFAEFNPSDYLKEW